MLIGIDPNMPPDLLHCLARMGHGDELVIADSNYPSESTAVHCVEKQVIQLPSMSTTDAISLITSVMPLDYFTEYAVLRMEVDNQPLEMTDAHIAAWEVLEKIKPKEAHLSSIERQSFYKKARKAFAVVQTMESRPFGCFILRKGVVFS